MNQQMLAFNESVQRLSSEVGELLTKLGQITALLENLPSLDDLKEMSSEADAIRISLQQAAEFFQEDSNLPTLDDLREMASAAGDLASSLGEAAALK